MEQGSIQEASNMPHCIIIIAAYLRSPDANLC
jgi:hypothetical protein